MAGEIIITVVGNLTADPELRFTKTGRQVASFTVAQTASTYNREKSAFENGETVFMRCTAWGEMAENVTKSLKKGNRVVATGRLSQGSYTNQQGQTVNTTDLTVDDIGASLRYATADITRIPRGDGNGNFGGGNSFNAAPSTPAPAASNSVPTEDPWANSDDLDIADADSSDDVPF